MLREVDDNRKGRARMASRWIVGLLCAVTVTFVAATAALVADTAVASAPYVSVEAKLERGADSAVVTGRVVWDQSAARQAPHYMSVGDLRLVAVSDHGHRPTLLATSTYDRIADEPTEEVRLPIPSDELHAVREGNRVVLTASQHGAVPRGTRTYVTVGQLQPFGSAQDRIGRRDCSDVAIGPGAQLNRCDLVGAYLDRALVSDREHSTRMLLADLTGATMRGATLSGLSIAGGRLNGADATRAVFDNVSLAGAEAIGLIADNATSDREEGVAGANFFDTRLTDAVFTDAVLNGLSLDGSRLNGANFRDATWGGVTAQLANFRGADLRGLKKVGGSDVVYMADFTDANLQRASLSVKDLEWATLCHTLMPTPPEVNNRDCRAATDPGPTPAPDPYVTVAGSLQRPEGRAEIQATVIWNATGIKSFRMSAGDIRVVAIDGSTGLPTTVGSESIPRDLPATTSYAVKITDRRLLAALNRGNRVVLTATQHEPLPGRATSRTTRSYVKVFTLQPGPGRGRVGGRDCSNIALAPTPPGPDGYDFCDLPGAVLTQAALSGTMREADLTGAELGHAGLEGMTFDGAAMAGAVMTGADFKGVKMINAFAPGLTMRKTGIIGAVLMAARLDDADFKGSNLDDTKFATASLRRATFSGATFDKVDLAYAQLPKAQLDGVVATASPSSLFLADLTGATLKDSKWRVNEAGEIPWEWATLCDTILPGGTKTERDCPR